MPLFYHLKLLSSKSVDYLLIGELQLICSTSRLISIWLSQSPIWETQAEY